MSCSYKVKSGKMAASGIQEHNEARRKERILMKKAKMDRRLRDLEVAEPQVTPAKSSSYFRHYYKNLILSGLPCPVHFQPIKQNV